MSFVELFKNDNSSRKRHRLPGGMKYKNKKPKLDKKPMKKSFKSKSIASFVCRRNALEKSPRLCRTVCNYLMSHLYLGKLF